MNDRQEKEGLIPWHAHTVADVLQSLKASRDGLAPSDAKKRLESYGINALPEKPPASKIKLLLSQFGNPLMIILVFAVGVSIFLQEWLDVGVIGAAVLLNAALGFIEEYKADRSLSALKSYLPTLTHVKRGGAVVEVSAREIVPGDILVLQSGDKITADARLIDATHFEVNEAPLTGESSPVEKIVKPLAAEVAISDRTNMVFAGTTVVSGNATAIVIGVGIHTQIGRITSLVADVNDDKTPLQKQLSSFARIIGVIVLILGAVIFAVGFLQDSSHPGELFYLAVALAVAAVPEGLVVTLTIILAIGMQRILKRKALARKLIAAETLGSVSVICVDKTGTITAGEMRVDAIWSNGFDENTLREVMARTNSNSAKKTPTETALFDYLQGEKIDLEVLREGIKAELPFNSENKFTARLFTSGELFVSGAPDILLARADMTDKARSVFTKQLEQMSTRGLRVIAFARCNDVRKAELAASDVKDIELVGLAGLRDPLRPETRESIELARKAGLRPVMVTGDHPETARAVGVEAGLNGSREGLVTGAELDEMTDEELRERIANIHIFARVVPEQKLRIVRAFQARGEVVAMTGDGVNDAPALKAADIGIAVGSGTEVAKEAADLVLLDNNFRTIVEAVREGRIIFDNIRKVAMCLLTDSFSEVVLVFFSMVFRLPLPILPAQILWINLITDGLPSVALAFEPGEPRIMEEPPRKKSDPIFNKRMAFLVFIIGIMTDLVLFGIYFYLLGKEVHIDEIRTFIFIALGLDSLFYVFALRTFRTSIFKSRPFQNKYLIGAVAIGLFLQVLPILFVPLRNAFGFVMLSPIEWAVLIVFTFIKLMFIELAKDIVWKNRKSV